MDTSDWDFLFESACPDISVMRASRACETEGCRCFGCYPRKETIGGLESLLPSYDVTIKSELGWPNASM